MLIKPMSLEDQIVLYAENKAKLDALKKVVDSDNIGIKSAMKDLGIDTQEAGNYVAKYTVQHRESMNEPALINILQEKYSLIARELGLIKMQPTIDWDAVENAIYHNRVSSEFIEDLNSVKEVKLVETLKVSKKKEKKK